jgi:hypothetical protein
MAKILLLPFLLFSSGIARAQADPIDTDRPDQTESAFTVPKYYFQAELGFNIEKDHHLSTIVHPTALWKYGLGKRIELRLITQVNTIERPMLIPAGNDFITGILPVEAGAKISLWEEKKGLPKTSLIFHVAMPKVASKKFQSGKWAPNFRLTMQNSLSDKVALGYNLGAEWDGESNTPYWIYTFAPGFNIGEKWYAYIEAFGAFRKHEPAQNSLDGGLAYYVSNNVKFDISAGVGISEAAPDHYIALGFSFRFYTAKKR